MPISAVRDRFRAGLLLLKCIGRIALTRRSRRGESARSIAGREVNANERRRDGLRSAVRLMKRCVVAASHGGEEVRGEANSSEDAASGSCGIAVMGKASRPGRTKTRLVPPLTFDEAAAFNTAFLKDVAANIAAAGQEASVACYMAYGPPGAAAFFHDHFPPSVGLIESWHPNFGDCLFVAIER